MGCIGTVWQRSARHAWRAAATAIAVTLVIAVSACGPHTQSAATTPAATAALRLPVGASDHSLSVGGVTRTFIVYRPANLSAAQRVPLVVMMHGGFGTGSQAERSYLWDAEADAGHFLVAYPDGLHRAWNAGGGCCGIPAKSGTDDIGFITAMVTVIEHAIPVDADRVYATGISNGGIMAYDLACHTTIFAAIGPDSATQLGSCPDPAPISVIAIHGTADKNIPYNGGLGDGPGHIDGPPVPTVNADWRSTDHCASPIVTTAKTVTTSIASCPAGQTVELITIAGAGHQWPGARPSWLAEHLLHTDPPSKALNATKVIWTFFASHPGG